MTPPREWRDRAASRARSTPVTRMASRPPVPAPMRPSPAAALVRVSRSRPSRPARVGPPALRAGRCGPRPLVDQRDRPIRRPGIAGPCRPRHLHPAPPMASSGQRQQPRPGAGAAAAGAGAGSRAAGGRRAGVRVAARASRTAGPGRYVGAEAPRRGGPPAGPRRRPSTRMDSDARQQCGRRAAHRGAVRVAGRAATAVLSGPCALGSARSNPPWSSRRRPNRPGTGPGPEKQPRRARARHSRRRPLWALLGSSARDPPSLDADDTSWAAKLCIWICATAEGQAPQREVRASVTAGAGGGERGWAPSSRGARALARRHARRRPSVAQSGSRKKEACALERRMARSRHASSGQGECVT